ncbi:type I restriction endonuclease subunit M [Sulfobacillus thermotolerans]|uniref:site-specific DNA-methyltransferase (adenine-specific) n=1 Tax=Sulfobacillus thermotolerans TaxID=338644 RepID=A0ABN5GZB4_9FIRM|nr:type I restriction endonuclease subunit M [Sulfobacillus thermotolerans]
MALTLQELESHLWESANILRGSIDSADYKNYIFGLLFLKRLNDVFEEERDALQNIPGADPDEPVEYQFFVPERARWSYLRTIAVNVGEAINKAFEALEEQNRRLEGVLVSIDFNNKDRLPDQVLLRLLAHFSQIRIGNRDLPEPDMLGRAYEYLIAQFADDAGKKGGEFYTPRGVVQLLVALLQPEEGMRICDPTVGSGGMLIESVHYIEAHGGNAKNVSLYGQEKNLNTWSICKMNMLLHGLLDARIDKGDTIRDPKLVDHGELMLFDRVIANPPFSLKNWGREAAEHDPYGRFKYSLPPKSYGDLAFVQHMVATLNVTGRLGVVMPHGILFRGNSEQHIRQGLLEDDLIDAVIGLPPNLFYGTGIPAAILIIRKAKPESHRHCVLFIEASRDFQPGKNQNSLRPEDIAKIVDAYTAYEDVEKYARVVSIEEIRQNGYNLNISRYVDTFEEQKAVDIGAVIRELRELEAQRAELEAKMYGYLKELGYEYE